MGTTGDNTTNPDFAIARYEGDPTGVLPAITINDVNVVEGDAGTVQAVFTVTLSEASLDTVTVDYASADDTATAPDDFTAVGPATLTFAPARPARRSR